MKYIKSRLCVCKKENIMSTNYLEWLKFIGADNYEILEEIDRMLYDRKSSGENITPSPENIMHAFDFFKPEETKIVLLGQDPYPTEGVANGLAFSYLGDKTPASLRNMYKELERDPKIDFHEPQGNDLSCWAAQGVLLLNTVLTTCVGEANYHKSLGWQKFTDGVIKNIEKINQPIIYLLLGGQAQKKKKLITNPRHFVVETSHPSPLGVYRGFAGSGCFSQVNDILKNNKLQGIDWNVKSKEDC